LNVLLVRAGALGDLLLLRRTIATLQQATRTVALLAPSGPAAALVGSGPGDVAEALPWESAGLAGLFADDGLRDAITTERLCRYDAALVYSRNVSLARNVGRLVRIVLQHDPEPPAGGPHAAEWLASCLPAIGVPAAGVAVPNLVPSEDDQARANTIAADLPQAFLAIHPGSGSPAKNWPAPRFAALVRSLGAVRWLLVRGPADDAAAALETVPGARVARDLPLRVLAALLARAGAYVGNDSGVTHLAAASGAPTIALFGATDPRVWGPLGPCVEVIRGGETMEGIAVDEVAAAVARRRGSM
jgi:ADP-heptose:LPS heptosyltransferase